MSNDTCSVDGCHRGRKYKLYCELHYGRMRQHGATELPQTPERSCSVTDCNEPFWARNCCKLHYGRLLSRGTTADPVVVARICDVDGCDRKHAAHGYCNMHWKRNRDNGDPLIRRQGGGVKQSLDVLFNAKVSPAGPDECWNWQGSLNAYGYGVVGANPQSKAHRVAYELDRGTIRADLMICHTCDNRRCVNPRHLYMGTALDNSNDRHSTEPLPRRNPEMV